MTPIEQLAHDLRFVRARQEHRAGKFRLYNDLPADVRNAIGARVFVVRVFAHDGFVEVHGWSPDFDPVAPGDVLPHYRWMYDTDTLDVSCVKESDDRSEVAQLAERGSHKPEAAGSNPALATTTPQPSHGGSHELREEDPARLDRITA